MPLPYGFWDGSIVDDFVIVDDPVFVEVIGVARVADGKDSANADDNYQEKQRNAFDGCLLCGAKVEQGNVEEDS